LGLVLDSTVFISGERLGLSVTELLESLRSTLRNQEICIAAMTAAELVHGIWRAGKPEIRVRREDFFEELFARVPVQPMTLRIAKLVGRIDAETPVRGATIPTADLIIGATAVDLGFAVATANLRHYRLIPGLEVRLLA